MKKILIVIVCLVLSSSAYAQLGGLGKKVSKGSNNSVSAEQVVRNYLSASGYVLNAQAKLLSALDLKEQADAASAQARKLTEGELSGDTIEETEKITTEGSKAIQDRLADESTVLEEEKKKEFGEAKPYLAKATLSYAATALDVKGYKPGMNLSSLNSAGRSAIRIGKSLPGDMSRLKGVIGAVKSYSESNNIADDGELDDATKSLGDF
jgi:hypothetical protein